MSPQVVHVQNLDASVLVDIFLDGFSTGIASAAKTFGGSDDTEADALADRFVAEMQRDPLVMEGVRISIRERLQGIDSGPKNLDATTAPKEN